MFDRLIRFALTHRMLVTSAAACLTAYGAWAVVQMPVDVFPDLNRTTVTVLTEAHGMTPEQVESQVTRHIETAVAGSPGVVRIRSSSSIGISIVHVEFEWGTPAQTARVTVKEKLDLLRDRLPKDVTPALGPVTSIMGEVMILGMTSERLPGLWAALQAAEDRLSEARGRASGSPADRADLEKRAAAVEAARDAFQAEMIRIRSLADWEVRPRLLTVPGVAQVIPMGGESLQYQVLADPVRLRQYGLIAEDVRRAVERGNENTAGGFVEARGLEFQVPVTGRTSRLEDFAASIVEHRGGVAVRLRDVADVRVGVRVKRGTAAVSRRLPDGSVEAAPAVLMTVQKQPAADTLAITQAVQEAAAKLEAGLNRDPASPSPVSIRADLFLQANFIRAGVANTVEALRDGGILVAVILLLFLMNLRTTAITLTAIPLSFVTTFLIFQATGQTINTMTLGGLAIAIGEICDDAVVDVENVFRRLRENRAAGNPLNPLLVVFRASREIRNSVVLSTLIVMFTFLPVLALSGIEGRLFAPMGIAYVVSLTASLLVSLTVNPVLCSMLLPRARAVEHGDGFLARRVKAATAAILRFTLRAPLAIAAVTAAAVAVCGAALAFVGKDFLPHFNEGTLTVEMTMRPGTALSESDRTGMIVQRLLHNVPEVVSTARRTGRADMDEHAEGVYYSETDVDLRDLGRPRAAVLADVRRELAKVPSMVFDVGQPISHRIDHMTSGIRSQVAIKIFGDDLDELRTQAALLADAVRPVPGVVDLKIERQILVPQIRVDIRREDAARVGFKAGELAEALETALAGSVVGHVIEGRRSYELVVWTPQEVRRDAAAMARTILTAPSGARVTLGQIADVAEGLGPNAVHRENGRRRIVVSCNVAGRDLASAVEAIRRIVAAKVEPAMPAGYSVEYGGQFDSQVRASRIITLLGTLAVAGSFLLLFGHFRSKQVAFQILLTIPQCFIGAVIAVLTNEMVSPRPGRFMAP